MGRRIATFAEEKRLLGQASRERDRQNDPEHIQHWTAGRFQRLLSDYFSVERVVYPFPWVLALCRK